jgi:hypothetical protein
MPHQVFVRRVVWYYKYTDLLEEPATAISKAECGYKSFLSLISKFESESVSFKKTLLYVIYE